jgi:excisionase family DNA binding protein
MKRPLRDKSIPDSKDEIDSVLTVQGVAEYLHLHRQTVYGLLKRKQPPAFKIGSGWQFNRESIDRWRLVAEQNLKRAAMRGRSPGK